MGLRWEDVHSDSITVDERFCRGDWGTPKSEASNATMAVIPVIERIQRLKEMTVNVRAGRAVRIYRVVKSARQEDLVFQSVKAGKPTRDNNALSRFIKPAGRKLGLEFVNWRCLRQMERGTKSPTLRTLADLAQAFSIELSAIIKAAERRHQKTDKR